jgi:diacylglycerol kinase
MKKKFSIADRLQSFSYAWSGIRSALQTEHNTWIHLALTIAAIVMGGFLKISRIEWMALVIAFGLVWMAELFNTAIEKAMDFISVDKHPQIKMIKDIAAAAVLIAAIVAVVIGCLIFIPKLL